MRDDDFFDKYVDSGNKTTKKGSVKKDLIGMKSAKTAKEKEPIVEEKLEEEIIDVVPADVEKVKTQSKPRKTKVTKDTTLDELVENEIDINNVEIVESASDTTDTMQTEENSEKKPKTRTRKKVQREITLEDYNTNYVTKSLSQTIHESMIPYSEFVIMDRAIPRVEDGLKPVQRRVLYSMLEVGVLPDRPYKKSASIVGECMGKYHPHGDTSIYDTLVRMAQPFNMCEPLVDGHGNFG